MDGAGTKSGGVRVGEGIREINTMKNGKKGVGEGVRFHKRGPVQDTIYCFDQGSHWSSSLNCIS